MKLTKAQKSVLLKIRDGKIWEEQRGEYYWLLHPSGSTAKSVFECEDLGLIERKKGAQLKHSVEWKFFLTEEGERSLEETEL